MQPFHDLPRATQTWSVFAPLAAADAESAPATLDFNRPVLLVGAELSIARTAAGSTLPTLADVLGKLELGSNRTYTSQRGKGIESAASFVDATALATGERRVFDLVLEKPDELIFTARWKVPTLASSTYCNVVVGLNLWGRYLDDDEAQRLLAAFKAGGAS